MRYAKKKKQIVHAWQLGAGSKKEAQLIAEGVIRKREDGSYELFSLEAVHGSGETAAAGDYFKIDEKDGKRYPFPNSKDYFESHHRHLEGDTYELITHPVGIWQSTDGPTPEVSYLVESGKLEIHEDDPGHYLNAELWGTRLSAAKDATIVFYGIDQAEDGTIRDVDFNFVSRPVFEASYDLV